MLTTLDNKTLIQHTKELVKRERLLSAKLIAYLAETDHRKLYADEGFPSMFRFLTEGLGYSEPAAHRRLTSARLSRRFPNILSLIESGAIHLTGLCLIASHITEKNADMLLNECSHKSKSQIEEILVKEFNGQSQCQREVIRFVPMEKKMAMTNVENTLMQAESVGQQVAPMIPLTCEPEVGVRLSLTLDKGSYEKLKRAQVIAGADNIADILKQAIDLFLDHKDQNRKMAKDVRAKKSVKIAVLSPEKVNTEHSVTVDEPEANSKRISIPTRRAVFKRDGAQCTYVSPESGMRCSETCRLEVDHIQARALGGSNDLQNLRLRCRSHNLLAARQVFGADFIEQKQQSAWG